MNEEKIQELIEDVEIINMLFNERISELHKVAGGQCERHAFTYYRSLLNEIKYKLRGELK